MNKNFKLLLAGQMASQVGDKFHMIALAFWVLETTGSSGKMGMVLAASLVPSLVLGFFSGSFVDRYSRKKIIVGTDLVRGLVLMGFVWLFMANEMNLGLIIGLQVILSASAAFFDPSIPAMIPQIVGKDSLARANAMHQAANSAALIGGAALGGMAVAGLGYEWIFFLNGMSFLISAGFESFIKIYPGRNPGTKNSLGSDIKAGYLYLLGSPSLVVILFMVMVIHFFVGAIEVFMPVIADHFLDNGPKTLGFFQAALVMSLLLSRSSLGGTKKTALFSSVMAMGCLQAVTFFLPGSGSVQKIGFILCFFFWGCAMIRAAVSFKTLIQALTKNEYAGRVFALAATIGNGSIPAAMIFFGLLLDKSDFQKLFSLSGLILAGLGLTFLILFKKENK
ncbi:MAG: MFS transporter [Desulfobacter sp.]|nr:MAG: MFS transporter [Desulfobacter sp.]